MDERRGLNLPPPPLLLPFTWGGLETIDFFFKLSARFCSPLPFGTSSRRRSGGRLRKVELAEGQGKLVSNFGPVVVYTFDLVEKSAG